MAYDMSRCINPQNLKKKRPESFSTQLVLAYQKSREVQEVQEAQWIQGGQGILLGHSSVCPGYPSHLFGLRYLENQGILENLCAQNTFCLSGVR